MHLITIIILIILAYILDILSKKYVKTYMVLTTLFLIGLISLLVIAMLSIIFLSELSIEMPLILKLFLIFISILPFIIIKEYIAHTIRILDFCINKKKLLEKGHIQKGVILEIKSYGLRQRRISGQYLVVDFNGEKIKSIPFKYHSGKTMFKTTYKMAYSEGKFSKEKTNEVLNNISQVYNIGDEIDVIIYNNKKYVKLKEY